MSGVVQFTDGFAGVNGHFSQSNGNNSYSDHIYVNSTGSDDNNGLNPSSPKRTVKNATDTISTNGVIHIANGNYNENNIAINKSMTFMGENRLNTRINGSGLDQIFCIGSGVEVTIKNLELTEGFANASQTYIGPEGYGGAIYNYGTLNICKSTFTNNNGKNVGGAIYNDENSTLTIVNSSFTNNHADFYGGAVCNYGSAKVTNSIFISDLVGNSYVKGSNRGGAIYNHRNGVMDVTCSTFKCNHADFYGGAVYSAGILNIDRSTFRDNVGTYSGGAIYNTYNVLTITNTNFINNSAELRGGAIYNAYNLLNATASTFTGNHGRDGGAIYNAYNLTRINNSTFTNNYVTRYGGAISSNADLAITSSSFTNNSAQKCGGAFYLRSGTSQIHFNRIVDNYGGTINNIGFDNSLGGMVDTTLNWWGSNTVPTDQFSTNIKYSPWLVLTLNTTPTNINNNNTSNVTTDLCHDNGILNDPSHPINYYHNPLNGHVPDGIMVKFTTKNGNLDPTVSFIINGWAKTNFIGFNSELSTFAAICDNQILETKIFNKISTTITISCRNVPIGHKINLTAVLGTKNNIPLPGRIVNFSVNGKGVGKATTDLNGKAEIGYIPLHSGNYTIKVTYNGDNNYSPSESTKLFIINNNCSIQPVNPQNPPNISQQVNNKPIQMSEKNIIPIIETSQKKVDMEYNGTNKTNPSNNQQKKTTINPWLFLLIIPILLTIYLIYNKKQE